MAEFFKWPNLAWSGKNPSLNNDEDCNLHAEINLSFSPDNKPNCHTDNFLNLKLTILLRIFVNIDHYMYHINIVKKVERISLILLRIKHSKLFVEKITCN
jgi:hypothetical protein